MATAHSLPLAIDRALRNSFFQVDDPGASGTFFLNNKGLGIAQVVTAAAESRVLPAASGFAVGTRLMVVFKKDGGDLTITGAESSVVLKNAAEVVEFVLVDNNGTKAWRQVSDSRIDGMAAIVDDADVQAISRNGMLIETRTAKTDTVTLTAAELLTKIIDGDSTAAATYTLPTAALLVAAIPGAKVGDTFRFVVNNIDAAFVITVAAGAGGTADGTLTVAVATVREFLVSLTNVTAAAEAYIVYGLGA